MWLVPVCRAHIVCDDVAIAVVVAVVDVVVVVWWCFCFVCRRFCCRCYFVIDGYWPTSNDTFCATWCLLWILIISAQQRAVHTCIIMNWIAWQRRRKRKGTASVIGVIGVCCQLREKKNRQTLSALDNWKFVGISNQHFPYRLTHTLNESTKWWQN